MHSIIAFATHWGSKYGGINTFNTDFLSAFGVAYHSHVQVICMVTAANEKEIEQAKNTHVTLVPLPYTPQDKTFTAEQATAAIAELKNRSIDFNPEQTVWLGHDKISGGAAIHTAQQSGGRSALIHHMSYDAYEAFAEDSQTAYAKTQHQKALFKQADLVLAVGPFLRDAAIDLLSDPEKSIHMLIPGLAEITPIPAPKIFSAFLSGRLSDDAAKIKQGHLGVAAFAKAILAAKENDRPESLKRSPKIVLRGVDFESKLDYGKEQHQSNPELELQQFAEHYAQARINLQALPYTQDREELYDNLKSASVALMPSWHEGFGLVAWEAMAAGVPVIISEDSGVYEFLKEFHPGAEKGFVNTIKVNGSSEKPFFNDADLAEVVAAITAIANDTGRARSCAASLRNMLEGYTWTACVENVVKHFDWNIPKGSTKTLTTEPSAPATNPIESISNTPPSPLQMPVKHWQPGRGISESQLLRADEALVPFDSGRQPVIDQLNDWLDNSEWPQAIRLITGAGGLGKTRLAIELCQQRHAAGWHCGFLGKSHLAKDMPAARQELLNIDQPILLVLDYAETRQAALLALIKAMLKQPGKHPVRVLLLARDSGEWWDNLPGKDADCEMLLSGYATSGPFVLPELYTDAASRIDAYRNALQAYANAIGADVPDVKPDLAGEHFSKPLYLQMAALLALYGERPATAEGLTKALLNHERRYWIDALADTGLHKPENHAQLLLALATLSGGFVTPKQAKTVWDAASGDDLSPAEFAALFNALVPLYPGNQGLQTVQPDLLGEALVAQALFQPQGEKLLDAVLGKSSELSIQHHALTVIARLSVHRPDLHYILVSAFTRNFCNCCCEMIKVAIETPSDLPALAQAAFMGLPTARKSQTTGLLKLFLINESIELTHLALEVNSFKTEKSRKQLDKKVNDINKIADHANNLSDLAIALYRVGDNEQALGIAKQALDINRQLVQKNPDRFSPDYARSLSNYANRLSDVGRNEEAIGFTKQALDIRQQLAQKNPDYFDPVYARSLHNYANRLSDVGRNEEAIGFTKQALDIHQRLAQKDPDRFDPNYASSLNNYASHLGSVGQNENIISFAKQALDIRQRLAQKIPDRFDPDYGITLNNYASHLSDIGRDEEALGFAKQALDIHQRLAQKNPDRFDPNYASCLNNYANRLSNVGKDKEAISFAEQALAIRQRLAQKNSVRFESDCYDTICNVLFLNWLSDKTLPTKIKREDIKNLPATITVHKKSSSLFCSLFVQACTAEEQAQRNRLLKQAITTWVDLSKADQHGLQEYFLCVCASLNQHDPASLPEHDWLNNWHKFHQQRQGRLPHWMHTVADRLEFKWPELKNT
ncbi:MAG: tetratricopeptide repeat protein [Methylobacter sp.]|nr:tetratricopeptide repeat protein [Methylobacter sp.]